MAMTNIEIYSLLGQNVISKPLSNTSEFIDVTSLIDGIYLAKIYKMIDMQEFTYSS